MSFFGQRMEFSRRKPASAANPNGSYEFELLNLNGTVIQEFALDASNSFAASITQSLLAGDYIIGLLADSPNDPSFTISFETAVDGVPASVPEPSSSTLLAFGLLAYLIFWCSILAVGYRSHRAVLRRGSSGAKGAKAKILHH